MSRWDEEKTDHEFGASGKATLLENFKREVLWDDTDPKAFLPKNIGGLEPLIAAFQKEHVLGHVTELLHDFRNGDLGDKEFVGTYVFSNVYSNFWLFLANFERLVLGCIEAEFGK